MNDLTLLPVCRHRGRLLGGDTVECRSQRLLHAEPGVAQLATCARPCPYADQSPERLPVPRVDEAVDVPCKYRGLAVRGDVCDLCSLRGQPMTVFGCALHGECTPHRQHSKIRSCAACLDRTTVWSRRTDIAPLKQRGPRPWQGCLERKPWDSEVTVMLPVLEPDESLDCILDLWRAQTVRPHFVLVDTGSDREALLELWDRYDADGDVEIHALRSHAWQSSSEPVAAAIDLALAVCQTEWLLLSHDDVFPRRRDLIQFLRNQASGIGDQEEGLPDPAALTPEPSPLFPVVGWQMSDRSHVTDQWRGMVSHTCTLLHVPSLNGLSWSLRRAHEEFGLPRTHASWPDTETGFNLLLRSRGIQPLLLGEEINYERQITRWWDHCRSYTGSGLYHSAHREQAETWIRSALAEGRERLTTWQSEV